MKAVAVTATVLAILVLVATIVFAALGIWTGDERFGGTSALGFGVFVVFALAASLSWVGVDE